MGVIMGKIVEVKGRPTQLILQALDEVDLEKQVNAIDEMERKSKAFDEVKEFVSEKLDEDIRHYHCFKSERDNGELAAYERIDDIIQEHMEDE